jgi:hypothetical protein
MSNLKELNIKLIAPDLNKEDGVILQKKPKFKVPLEDSTIQQELNRQLTSECGKKCIDYTQGTQMSNGEKLCVNRCYSKFMNLK